MGSTSRARTQPAPLVLGIDASFALGTGRTGGHHTWQARLWPARSSPRVPLGVTPPTRWLAGSRSGSRAAHGPAPCEPPSPPASPPLSPLLAQWAGRRPPWLPASTAPVVRSSGPTAGKHGPVLAEPAPEQRASLGMFALIFPRLMPTSSHPAGQKAPRQFQTAIRLQAGSGGLRFMTAVGLGDSMTCRLEHEARVEGGSPAALEGHAECSCFSGSEPARGPPPPPPAPSARAPGLTTSALHHSQAGHRVPQEGGQQDRSDEPQRRGPAPQPESRRRRGDPRLLRPSPDPGGHGQVRQRRRAQPGGAASAPVARCRSARWAQGQRVADGPVVRRPSRWHRPAEEWRGVPEEQGQRGHRDARGPDPFRCGPRRARRAGEAW